MTPSCVNMDTKIMAALAVDGEKLLLWTSIAFNISIVAWSMQGRYFDMNKFWYCPLIYSLDCLLILALQVSYPSADYQDIFGGFATLTMIVIIGTFTQWSLFIEFGRVVRPMELRCVNTPLLHEDLQDWLWISHGLMSINALFKYGLFAAGLEPHSRWLHLVGYLNSFVRPFVAWYIFGHLYNLALGISYRETFMTRNRKHLRLLSTSSLYYLLYIADRGLGSMDLAKVHMPTIFVPIMQIAPLLSEAITVICLLSIVAHWHTLTSAIGPDEKYAELDHARYISNAKQRLSFYVRGYGVDRVDRWMLGRAIEWSVAGVDVDADTAAADIEMWTLYVEEHQRPQIHVQALQSMKAALEKYQKHANVQVINEKYSDEVPVAANTNESLLPLFEKEHDKGSI